MGFFILYLRPLGEGALVEGGQVHAGEGGAADGDHVAWHHRQGLAGEVVDLEWENEVFKIDRLVLGHPKANNVN